ncbi:DUF6414 family protein [Bacillus mojavensis]
MKLKKVIYFDEGSATDFLQIHFGGNIVIEDEEQEKILYDVGGSAKGELKAGNSFFSFLKASFSMSGNAEFSNSKNSIYKTTISNTILSDFVDFSNDLENTREIEERLGSAIYSRFDNFVKYLPLSTEAKKEIMQRSYESELENFNKEDREFLEKEGILEKMTPVLDQLHNAREIHKFLKRLLSFPLIERI